MPRRPITDELLNDERRIDLHEYLVEASEIGLPPGPFPTWLESDGRVGNGLDFVLTGLNVGATEATYRQDGGNIVIRVAND